MPTSDSWEAASPKAPGRRGRHCSDTTRLRGRGRRAAVAGVAPRAQQGCRGGQSLTGSPRAARLPQAAAHSHAPTEGAHAPTETCLHMFKVRCDSNNAGQLCRPPLDVRQHTWASSVPCPAEADWNSSTVVRAWKSDSCRIRQHPPGRGSTGRGPCRRWEGWWTTLHDVHRTVTLSYVSSEERRFEKVQVFRRAGFWS